MFSAVKSIHDTGSCGRGQSLHSLPKVSLHSTCPCSVKRTEAERYLEGKEERDKLRAEVQAALRAKGIDLELPGSASHGGEPSALTER